MGQQSSWMDGPGEEALPGGPEVSHDDVPFPEEEAWRRLDASVRAGWDHKLGDATEKQIRASPPESALLFLPSPFVFAFDAQGVARETMFNWDNYFVDCSLLVHDRKDLVRDHIRNYLFMVERYGYVTNMNHTAGVTRSQTPVYPESIWRYYLATDDSDLLCQAYPLLKKEYQQYWKGSHHGTEIGLATNRDLGDRNFTPQMAAEAETGLDWTPIYNGDVRRCVPLITNCALVRFAQLLDMMATVLGRTNEASQFAREATTRAQLIRDYCWNAEAGLFMEYDYVSAEQLPYVSACAFWPLWAGVATFDQAKQLVANVARLEHTYGLAFTDRPYPDPHPAPESTKVLPDVPPSAVGGLGQLQWMYPAGWACMQLIAVEGLDLYGFHRDAKRIASRFLSVILKQYHETGRLWEKYNVVDGSLHLPNSRYGNSPYVSWTAAAAVLLGRRLFIDEAHVLTAVRERLDHWVNRSGG